MKKQVMLLVLMAFFVPGPVHAQSKTRWQRLKDRFNYELAELNDCIRQKKQCDPVRKAFYITAALLIVYVASKATKKTVKYFTRIPEPTIEDVMGHPEPYVPPVKEEKKEKEPALLQIEMEQQEQEEQKQPEQPEKPIQKKEEEIEPVKLIEPEKKESKQEEDEGYESGTEGYESAEEEEIEAVIAEEENTYKSVYGKVEKNLADIVVNIYEPVIQESQNFYQQATTSRNESAKLRFLRQAVAAIKATLQKVLEGKYDKFHEMAKVRLNTSISSRIADRRDDLQGDINLAQAFYNNAQKASNFDEKVQQLEKAVTRLKGVINTIESSEQATRKQGD